MPQGFGRATFDFSEGGDTYRYAMEVSGDGGPWTTFVDGEYHRR
jgi:hypothetical protein